MTASCKGGDKKKEPAPTAGSSAAASGSAAAADPAAKPPAPAAALKGDSRVVNLLVDEGGKPVALDIWGKRSFEYGPMQFAKDLAYGQATPHFGIPKGTSTIAVAAGSGDKGKEMGSVWASQDGEEITTVMYRDGATPRSIVLGMKPPGTHNAPEPPKAGTGLVVMYAGPIDGLKDKLTERYGGATFYVGDGSTTCRAQRGLDVGKGTLLGGTNVVTFELPPGNAKFSLHKWVPGKDCTTPAVFDLEVDVVDGKGTYVILHSPDVGGTVAALQFPIWK